jgi:hypothetical protein
MRVDQPVVRCGSLERVHILPNFRRLFSEDTEFYNHPCSRELKMGKDATNDMFMFRGICSLNCKGGLC